MTSELADLEQALIMANKVNLAGAPGVTKAEVVRALGRMRNMFDALEAHTINSFEATKERRAEGHMSVVNYQKHPCRRLGQALQDHLAFLDVCLGPAVEGLGPLTRAEWAVAREGLVDARELAGRPVRGQLNPVAGG